MSSCFALVVGWWLAVWPSSAAPVEGPKPLDAGVPMAHSACHPQVCEPAVPDCPAANETRQFEPVVPLRLPGTPRVGPSPKDSRRGAVEPLRWSLARGAALPIQSQHVRLQI